LAVAISWSSSRLTYAWLSSSLFRAEISLLSSSLFVAIHLADIQSEGNYGQESKRSSRKPLVTDDWIYYIVII
jgi:hypothetical protein